ncbi:3D (Asp-Asp-Asp) domain-containing protein [Deinococcus yavapaiensis KR-236]|uniref:3D (Asp-Asp-Asp) domain-containing protein n=2 Tax=Deinococcus TaxID=1298 RepID=A0A318SC74_9DEIO|nr:3D (Asp-Asp-Asp) domain-containing protein [Deinococcus yavapaiensis KR-236]
MTGVALAATPILPDAAIATTAVRAALETSTAPSKATPSKAPAAATSEANTPVPPAVAAFQQAVAPRVNTVASQVALANTAKQATVVKTTAKTTATKTTASKTATTTKTAASAKTSTTTKVTTNAKASTSAKSTATTASAKKTVVPTPAQVRQTSIARVQQTASLNATGRSTVVRATAYNSLANQTDSTPFVTATGTRTRFGVIALSRDLLRLFPYGTRVRLEDLSGQYSNMLRNQIFIVEDTMHPRKANTIDVWMSSRSQALQWGARTVRITALR